MTAHQPTAFKRDAESDANDMSLFLGSIDIMHRFRCMEYSNELIHASPSPAAHQRNSTAIVKFAFKLIMRPFGGAIVRRAQTVSRWQRVFEQKIKLSDRYVALYVVPSGGGPRAAFGAIRIKLMPWWNNNVRHERRDQNRLKVFVLQPSSMCWNVFRIDFGDTFASHNSHVGYSGAWWSV